MKIFSNYDLSKLNTFGVKAQAKFFAEVCNENDIVELFSLPEFKNSQRIFLGGGSNVLFTKDFDGIVILNKLKGIEIIKEDENFVYIKSMGGEMWNDLVNFTVQQNYWGIENLALIPGTVGAAPMQNIGAYGTELKDTLQELEALDIEKNLKKTFLREECEFGYRESVFKNKLKGQYFILSVILKLDKNFKPNISYRALSDYLKQKNIEIKKSKDVSDAVSEIRMSKLPDPKLLGNAGSFFKNVFIDADTKNKLAEKFPNMPFYEDAEAIKVPAGWLIEQCGPEDGISWKGRRIGNVGMHEKQALVLVNYGGATGEEVFSLAQKIIDSVFTKFGLKISPEVNLI